MSVSPHAEQLLWKASASQIYNAFFFLACLLAVVGILVAGSMVHGMVFWLLPIPLLAAGVRWLVTRCKTYELTPQRLRICEGVLSRSIEDIELFRIKDTKLTQPFVLRLLGMGNIEVLSSDQLERTLYLKGVSNAIAVREQIRRNVNEQRSSKGVREIDMR